MRLRRIMSLSLVLVAVGLFLAILAGVVRTQASRAPSASPAPVRLSSRVVAEPISSSVLSALSAAQHDLTAVLAARPDQRNLYDLTRRLKLHQTRLIDPYIRSSSPDYKAGRVDSFFVAQATSGYFTMKARLLLVTPHVYWYVERGTTLPRGRLMELLRRSAHDFETHVLPVDHAAFGREWTPGVDRDPHITILCADLPGVGGYYSAEDLYPHSVNRYSNQRKMLYVNITSFPLGTPDFASTVAHEFQHMIHWYQHERDDTWINEGSSVLAQVLNGYTPDGQDSAFAALPETQVNAFCYGPPYCSSNDSYAHYGAGFQWMFYVYQHYGGDTALRAVLADRALSGTNLFDDVLRRLHSRDTARDVLAKWSVANLVDDPTIYHGEYGYKPVYRGCCIRVMPRLSATSYPYTSQGLMNQYAARYVEMRPDGHATLHIHFSGDPTVPIVPNVPIQSGQEWWSNRGDEMDSTLTRQFDFRHVRRPDLRYDAWYDIEKDFDYGYVEASTDNGRTWYTLKTAAATNSNPNGANYGNGYTGESTGVRGNRKGWISLHADLSRYAGRRVLIRFEYITDDAFNLSGMTLDHIRVPAIHFYDRPGLGGWQMHGWTRIENRLPTRWIVQLVLYTTKGIVIRQVPISSTGDGTVDVTGIGSTVQRIVAVLNSTATQTTIQSRYRLQVSAR